jgi:hypothetical protein
MVLLMDNMDFSDSVIPSTAISVWPAGWVISAVPSFLCPLDAVEAFGAFFTTSTIFSDFSHALSVGGGGGSGKVDRGTAGFGAFFFNGFWTTAASAEAELAPVTNDSFIASAAFCFTISALRSKGANSGFPGIRSGINTSCMASFTDLKGCILEVFKKCDFLSTAPLCSEQRPSKWDPPMNGWSKTTSK